MRMIVVEVDNPAGTKVAEYRLADDDPRTDVAIERDMRRRAVDEQRLIPEAYDTAKAFVWRNPA
jgi:hypothetical protein